MQNDAHRRSTRPARFPLREFLRSYEYSRSVAADFLDVSEGSLVGPAVNAIESGCNVNEVRGTGQCPNPAGEESILHQQQSYRDRPKKHGHACRLTSEELTDMTDLQVRRREEYCREEYSTQESEGNLRWAIPLGDHTSPEVFEQDGVPDEASHSHCSHRRPGNGQ